MCGALRLILTALAMHFVFFVLSERLARFVAMLAVLAFRKLTVCQRRPLVNFVATEARHLTAVEGDVADIVHHVSVGRVEFWIVHDVPIDLQQLQQMLIDPSKLCASGVVEPGT